MTVLSEPTMKIGPGLCRLGGQQVACEVHEASSAIRCARCRGIIVAGRRFSLHATRRGEAPTVPLCGECVPFALAGPRRANPERPAA